MTLDVTKLTEAKSDQLNAVDVAAAPRIIRIRDVQIKGGDQPLHIYYDDDTARPFKPSKTATRTLAACYGLDAKAWIGKHIELYCDDTVVWAGVPVGGLRLKSAEGLTKPLKIMLPKSRGKKEAVTIMPLDMSRVNAASKPTTREPIIDRAEMQRQADAAKEMSPEEKKEWWGKLNEAEKAVVRELTAKKEAGDE